MGAGDRRSGCRSRRRRHDPACRDRAAAPVHGRGLCRLLLVARARDEHRPHVPSRFRAAAPELAPPAGRLPRPRRDGRRQRHAGAPTAGAGHAARRRRADLRAVAAARPRARARLRRRRPQHARRAGAGVRLPRARLRRPARQRLERPRPSGVGVRAARPVPRQELRHLDLGLGDPARAARGSPRRRTRAGPQAAAAPSGRGRLGLRPAARDRAERQRDLARQRAQPLLDDAAAARPCHVERREYPDGRPDGLGNDLRRRPGDEVVLRGEPLGEVRGRILPA